MTGCSPPRAEVAGRPRYGRFLVALNSFGTSDLGREALVRFPCYPLLKQTGGFRPNQAGHSVPGRLVSRTGQRSRSGVLDTGNSAHCLQEINVTRRQPLLLEGEQP